jgi:hypothetical protein
MRARGTDVEFFNMTNPTSLLEKLQNLDPIARARVVISMMVVG